MGKQLRRVVRTALSAATALLVVACGGGGGGGDDSTPLPVALSASAPAGRQAVGLAVVFTSNAGSADDYRFAWSFGDGASSDLAAPSHVYARGGVYTVTLTVTNGDGETASSTATVTVADLAVVAGKACDGVGQSGWCWQQPLPQGNYIADFVYADDRSGYAVGAFGALLKTTDGGLSWQGQASGTRNDLRVATIVDASVAWVAGDRGEVLKTIDGGAAWQRFSSGRSVDVQTIGAADANRAWIVDNGSGVSVTHDGGRQWQLVAPPRYSYVLAAVSDTEVWAADPVSSASLQHTVDAGTTWVDVALPPPSPGSTAAVQALQFTDPAHGLVSRFESGYDPALMFYVSRQLAYLTADRGATWQPIGAPIGNNFNLFRYTLAGASTVYAFDTGYSVLQRTTDLGATWTVLALPTFSGSPIYLSSLRAFGPDRLLVKDYLGRAFLSLDGGATWNQRDSGGPSPWSYNGVWFFDAREGIAWADDGTSARTTDGGKTWARVPAVVGFGWRRGQFLSDGSVGWIAGNDGRVYRSNDKGRSWAIPAVPGSATLDGVSDFHFVDALHGYAVSPYGDNGQSALWRSSDGGLTWERPSTARAGSGLLSIRFADASHGVAVGPAGVAVVSSDGGSTWAPRPTGGSTDLVRVTFADPTTAVAVGRNGSIVRSTDRGMTWSTVPSPTSVDLEDVRFLDARIGHAVGGFGVVIVTRDGGLTWTRTDAATGTTLRAVFFADETTGWVVGNNGAILATATGGR